MKTELHYNITKEAGHYVASADLGRVRMEFSFDENGVFQLHAFSGGAVSLEEIDELRERMPQNPRAGSETQADPAPDLHTFLRDHREGAAPENVTGDLLRQCRKMRSQIDAVEDEDSRAELEKFLRAEADRPLGRLLLDPQWLDIVGYILSAEALNPMAEGTAEADDWEDFAEYLRLLVPMKQRSAEKFRYLCDLVEKLVGKEKKEWKLILSAPADYLKLAEADPSFFEDEKPWEPEWFCDSVLVRSELLRCRDNRRKIASREADAAAERMPLGSWGELSALMPRTCRLYPQWERMLKTIVQKRLSPVFPGAVPEEIAGFYDELARNDGEALRYFLEKKVFFSCAQKSGGGAIKDLSDLSMDWIYREASSAGGRNKR